MNIVHKLALDFQMPVAGKIYVKQGDTMTRSVILSLYDGGTVFNTANAGIFQIVFLKPDKTGGVYDTMPDNTTACTVDGNEVTAKLHPQMFTSPGSVKCELRMLNTGGSKILSSFSWIIYVEASAEDGIKSESYYRFNSVESLAAAIGELNKLNTEAKNSLVDAINELSVAKKQAVYGEAPVDGLHYEAVVEGLVVERGLEILLTVASTNQGDCDLAINGGEAYPLCYRPGYFTGSNYLRPELRMPLEAEMLLRGAEYVFRFDGYSWILQSFLALPDEGGCEIPAQDEEPEAGDGALWIDTDAEPESAGYVTTEVLAAALETADETQKAYTDAAIAAALAGIGVAEEGAY